MQYPATLPTSPPPGLHEDGPAGLRRFHRVVGGIVMVGSALLVALAVWLEADPRGMGTHEQLGFLPCGLLLFTGIPCPTCGMTTAFAHMMHLQPLQAAQAQPLGALLAILAVVHIPVGAWGLYTGRPILDWWLERRYRPVLVTVIALGLGSWWYKIETLRGGVLP